MRTSIRRKLWLSFLLATPGVAALAVYVMAGFPKGKTSEEGFARFKPSEEAARSALEAALRSWQKGEPLGKLVGPNGTAVVLNDTCRQPGQTLEQFRILGEAPGDGPRCFAVRVSLRNPDEEQRLRFVVYGVDPLWVFRYEDYEMYMHWECGREERERDRKAAIAKKNSE
jgi:hypothetical protein